ncbi:HAMP domain-containing protein [bacterium M00.F.Ca.ET.228.01.1.1]|uniref:ATP-binding protein n=2 Tax=Pseudomonadota TaxID=1224 RepID=UPI0010929E7E|nr:ATP-binding protein [Paraburkholderia phenoliruptrix]TGP40864.1 HAMP domain-containing protein [bacterium M00.F.Ca.ET.228.01.1.1]TGR97180.1 HAMP domain-containing protein [bacterium M00.F.Ca.ET.191.01.1.1]TGU01693.1 HAMP domain-containing protein [bacterium M00.F.Ca.ET.155.01.1.1]MBW0449732.1 HAMP domain-containing protein [Paraburkholderia phenoliruptrix]MBW9100809.1 HAMP domain-containing protein [Paraburkholderia phenoliruptrix]
MRNPLNTLFGRMALLSTAVLLAIQAGWFVLIVMQPPRHEIDGFARGVVLALQAVNGEPIQGAALAPAMRVHLVPTWNMPPSVHLREPTDHLVVQLTRHLRETLPPGTQIAVDDLRPPQLWVLFPGKSNWVVLPVHLPPPPRFLIEAVSMLVAALILSLFAVWQMQRPLSRVADAARAFGSGGRPEPVTVQGPRELRDLIGSFNDMMRRLNEAGDDQAVMLAGVAHDLKAPLTRLKLRASVLVAESERAGLIRDVDSLTNIVQQFLEFAGQSADAGPPVAVDGFLREQFSDSANDSDSSDSNKERAQANNRDNSGARGDDSANSASAAPDHDASDNPDETPLFRLDLRAGPSFTLPRTLLDRLVTNLVENALEHGAPPVEISTARRDERWLISVRDHGGGIPDDRIAAAMKPFVRLDAARGGEGHCGLGLAIVARLAHDRGGSCHVRNHAKGGLEVCIELPVVAALAAASASVSA